MTHPIMQSVPEGCRVMGVLDLMRGQAVHAIAGRRHTYQPTRIPHAEPGDALALARHYLAYGVSGLYIADLDAIEDGTPNWERLAQLRIDQTPLWLDLGLTSPEHLAATVSEGRRRFSSLDGITWILATETAGCRFPWRAWRDAVPQSVPLAVGLDFNGSVLIGSERSPEEIMAEAVEAGIHCSVVLDLRSVGTQSGPSVLTICEKLVKSVPGLRIASGGGVRDGRDLIDLHRCGCHWVLVATALL